MKILAFSDMHGDMAAFSELKKKAKDADIIICAGDISTFERNLKTILSKLSELKKPVLMINGNHEDAGILKKLCSNFKNILFIHRALYTIDNFQFVGYGGGGFSRSDIEFEKYTKQVLKDFDRKKKKILITHAPPYGTTLDLISKEHSGNKSIRNFIKEHNIDVAISCHLHECSYHTDTLNKSYLINPGPRGTLIEVL
jgi:uncharacterized protein